MRVSVINRFWFYTKVTNKDTCWEWTESNKKNVELARMFCVTKSNIGNIKKGKTWKHLIKK